MHGQGLSNPCMHKEGRISHCQVGRNREHMRGICCPAFSFPAAHPQAVDEAHDANGDEDYSDDEEDEHHDRLGQDGLACPQLLLRDSRVCEQHGSHTVLLTRMRMAPAYMEASSTLVSPPLTSSRSQNIRLSEPSLPCRPSKLVLPVRAAAFESPTPQSSMRFPGWQVQIIKSKQLIHCQ